MENKNLDKTFYITTPIYYANAKPHMGHAYTNLLVHIMKTHYETKGYDTYYATGTDEFGDKIVKAAANSEMSAKDYTDKISQEFRNLWSYLGIEADKFIRTTDIEHQKVVQDILKKVYEKGDIYFAEYEGLYCVGCERFLGVDELVDGNCKDHLVAPSKIKEKNYFFKMSSYTSKILDHIKSNPEFIIPENFRNEVISLLSDSNQHDLCISRPISRLTWGIPLPFDSNYVTYVWFDALINYISLLGYPDGLDFRKFWNNQSAYHVIAKDILRPHCV